ncbi:MAG: SppA protein [Proteobacteria bacterium]|nr:SppA protein [Pseudomonadota bacterium]
MEQKDASAIAERFAAKYEVDLVAYFGDVIRDEASYLIEQCRKRRKRKNILLLLATYGGDPNAAYRIARAFQDAYRTVAPRRGSRQSGRSTGNKEGNFTVYVDTVCKSAGTLICLGADRLIMSDHAELGPIDTQLRKIDEVGERTSGLTPIQAVNFLEQQSVLLFKRHFNSLRDARELGFSTKMAAEIATNISTGLLTPIYQQLDPIRLAEVDRSLRIAKEYGDRLWCEKNCTPDAVERLLASYPSHGFVIDRREAREIFKNVDEPSEDEEELFDAFSAVARYMVRSDDETFAWYVSDEPPKAVPVPAASDSEDVSGENAAAGADPDAARAATTDTPEVGNNAPQ